MTASAHEPKPRPPARVVGLLARAAPVVVVLRRGPSSWTRVLSWDLTTDQVTPGDWLRGGLDFTRCDVSPDGRLFVYFASYVRGGRTAPAADVIWTGVSEPPSLRPLIRWPRDDSWSGGGLFFDDPTLDVFDFEVEAVGESPAGLEVRRAAGAHRYELRLERSGFHVVKRVFADREWDSDRSEVRRKTSTSGAALELTRARGETVAGTHTYVYVAPDGDRTGYPDLTWADFDPGGRVVGAARGQLVAAPLNQTLAFDVVADLNDMAPPRRAT